MRFLPARDDALLIECASLEQALALHTSLRDDPLPGTGELVPGARTVLVYYDPRAVSAAAMAEAVRTRATAPSTSPHGRLIKIPVTYTGEDLAEVAALLGITPAEVVARHTATQYTVAFTGFAPGFAYLTGGDGALTVPRRATPRTRIPGGSVALAGAFSGVYPRDSPGGWQIIGTTPTKMWDLARDRPALLVPGDRVRFIDAGFAPSAGLANKGDAAATAPSTGTSSVPTPAAASPHPAEPAPLPAPDPDPAHALEIVRPGTLTLLQDLGRPGMAALGVPVSGAADPVSLRAANRLVGNDAAVACLELTFGGTELRARGSRVLAVAGAGVPLQIVRGDGSVADAPFGLPFVLAEGETLSVGVPAVGVRSYLAVRGGFDVTPVLGSLSTDLLSGIGPAPVAAGTILPVRTPTTGLSAVALEPVAPVTPGRAPSAEVLVVVLDVVLGPRTDWFTPEAVSRLESQTWTVSSRSNRIGLRLDGEPLPRSITDELPSEGTVTGAIQVPTDGKPVLFLVDHPVTGGYPVIAAVARHHLPLAAQLPPGTALRLRPIAPFAAIPGESRPR